MASLARRLGLNLQQRLLGGLYPTLLARQGQGLLTDYGGGDDQRMAMVRNNRFMATTSNTEKASDDKEVAVSRTKDSKSRPFPRTRRHRRRSSLLWNDDPDVVPALYDVFPSGLGNALLQATQNVNKLFQNIGVSPWQLLLGLVKEKDDHYRVQLHVPGLAKEDIKVTVHDGVLTVRGEHKEEEEGSDKDEEYWSTRSYGYYNTSLQLPEDAKVDEIKAELKDGVLRLVIPKTEEAKKDVKEVAIQ